MNLEEKNLFIIQNLIANNNKPSQELIDYYLDLRVNEMLKKALKAENYQKNMLILQNTVLEISDNKLSIPASVKDFDYVFESLKKSLSRYAPYVTIHDGSNPLSFKDEYKDIKDNNNIVDIGFCLKLKLTPEMKQYLYLNKDITDAKPKQHKSKI